MGEWCQGGWEGAGELASSTAKQIQTFLLAHTGRRGEREEEGSVMQENEILHQQGQSLVQLPRTWNSAWKPGLLGADGLHLSEKGKSIISHRLAKLVGMALKFPWEGTFCPSHSYQMNARASRRCPEPGEGSHVRKRACEEQQRKSSQSKASLGARFKCLNANARSIGNN